MEHPAVPLPERRSLSALRAAAQGCRACELWEEGTQTVSGSGPRRAQIMLVGEQPGDREDRDRIHQRPAGNHIRACRPWVEAELEAVAPVVAR